MATPDFDDNEVFDLEEAAKHGRPIPPRARRFRIHIDREFFVVEVDHMRGREILALAGKNPPENFTLHQAKPKSMPVKIGLDEVVSFRDPGIERFLTLPRDQTEGLAPTRRQFSLPAEDECFLDGSGMPWEAVLEAAPGGGTPVKRVVIHGVPVHAGYNHSLVSLYFKIEGLYPDTQIDMAYVFPALARADGQTINNLAVEEFDGKTWQRWSRHRTDANPWRPGLDSIETHFTFVGEWFRHEFTKR